MARDHWLQLVTTLGRFSLEELNQYHERAARMRYEDGAAFNPFKDLSEPVTSWTLDMLPLPLPVSEWNIIERGLIQRAGLLEKILADVYGPQELIKSGKIPAEIIYNNPNFLIPCHGIQPAAKRFLTFYAADLYRDVDGCFRVLRDYGANPAGLGYALENRMVVSRTFSEFYHENPVRRLWPFLQAFHQDFIQKVLLNHDDPDIVLLSPGPASPMYFEHALLSRYLNCPLVEGEDLTVRDGEVFLKELSGLKPIQGIFRHLADSQSDPFALRKSTSKGVAGLIQISREQNAAVINPIGSGFIETPALASLLPVLHQHLLNEKMILENHPTWWCKSMDSLNFVLNNLSRLTVMPAMSRSVKLPSDLASAIREAPHAFAAQKTVFPSSVPVWGKQGFRSSYAVMRVFAFASAQGFSVMPGGLAIVADEISHLLGNSFDKQQSKDIWVYSDKPLEHTHEIKDVRIVSNFKRGSDLPSRVADHLLWLGRYLERAEARVRLIRSVFQRMTGEHHLKDIPEIPYLLDMLRAQHIIPKLGENEEEFSHFRELAPHLNQALYHQEQTESIISILNQVQRSARNVRDRLSFETLRVINRLGTFSERSFRDPLELLDDILFALSAFSGLAMESMTRGLGWRFMDSGRRIERAILLTDLIYMGVLKNKETAHSNLEVLLEMSSSIMTYRSRYKATFQFAPVLDLLLIDESNPKSLAFQCSQLADHVEHLPKKNELRFSSPEEKICLEMLTSVRLLDLTSLKQGYSVIENIRLTDFIQSITSKMKMLAKEINIHYLTRVPSVPHYSSFPRDRET